MSLYQNSRYYHSPRPSIYELDEMIEGGLHPKERKLPKLTNIGPQDPNLIASWDMVKDVNEVDQQQISDHRINLLGDLAIQEYDEFDAITEDTFARYPRFRDLGFDIDR